MKTGAGLLMLSFCGLVFLARPVVAQNSSEKQPEAEKGDSNGPPNSSLHLLLDTGGQGSPPSPSVGVTGLHGLAVTATNWNTRKQARTNVVDMLATSDYVKIVVLILDYGPLYESTNSGATWSIITKPGRYDLQLCGGNGEIGWISSARLVAPPGDGSSGLAPPANWYILGAAPDGSSLAIMTDFSTPAPLLRIVHTNGTVVLSWPSGYDDYVLQANNDLATTNWINLTNAVSRMGSTNQVILSDPIGADFYRLNAR